MASDLYSSSQRELESKLAFKLNEDWLRKVQEQLLSANPSYGTTPSEVFTKAIFQQVLNCDLRVCAALQTVPTNIQRASVTVLQGKFLLQLLETIDISQPTRQRYQSDCNRSSHTFKFSLTDGFSLVVGISHQPIAGLDATTPAGAKLFLQGPINAREGLLLLTPTCCKVYGGRVERLNSAQEKVAAHLNQPVVGYRGPPVTIDAVREKATTAAYANTTPSRNSEQQRAQQIERQVAGTQPVLQHQQQQQSETNAGINRTVINQQQQQHQGGAGVGGQTQGYVPSSISFGTQWRQQQHQQNQQHQQPSHCQRDNFSFEHGNHGATRGTANTTSIHPDPVLLSNQVQQQQQIDVSPNYNPYDNDVDFDDDGWHEYDPQGVLPDDAAPALAPATTRTTTTTGTAGDDAYDDDEIIDLVDDDSDNADNDDPNEGDGYEEYDAGDGDYAEDAEDYGYDHGFDDNDDNDYKEDNDYNGNLEQEAEGEGEGQQQLQQVQASGGGGDDAYELEVEDDDTPMLNRGTREGPKSTELHRDKRESFTRVSNTLAANMSTVHTTPLIVPTSTRAPTDNLGDNHHDDTIEDSQPVITRRRPSNGVKSLKSHRLTLIESSSSEEDDDEDDDEPLPVKKKNPLAPQPQPEQQQQQTPPTKLIKPTTAVNKSGSTGKRKSESGIPPIDRRATSPSAAPGSYKKQRTPPTATAGGTNTAVTLAESASHDKGTATRRRSLTSAFNTTGLEQQQELEGKTSKEVQMALIRSPPGKIAGGGGGLVAAQRLRQTSSASGAAAAAAAARKLDLLEAHPIEEDEEEDEDEEDLDGLLQSPPGLDQIRRGDIPPNPLRNTTASAGQNGGPSPPFYMRALPTQGSQGDEPFTYLHWIDTYAATAPPEAFPITGYINCTVKGLAKDDRLKYYDPQTGEEKLWMRIQVEDGTKQVEAHLSHNFLVDHFRKSPAELKELEQQQDPAFINSVSRLRVLLMQHCGLVGVTLESKNSVLIINEFCGGLTPSQIDQLEQRVGQI